MPHPRKQAGPFSKWCMLHVTMSKSEIAEAIAYHTARSSATKYSK